MSADLQNMLDAAVAREMAQGANRITVGAFHDKDAWKVPIRRGFVPKPELAPKPAFHPRRRRIQVAQLTCYML